MFATELDLLGREARDRLLDALYLASSGPAWEARRHDRRLTAGCAGGVVRRTVGALLDPPGGRP